MPSAPVEWIVAQGYNIGLEEALGKNLVSLLVSRDAKKLKSEFPRVFSLMPQ